MRPKTTTTDSFTLRDLAEAGAFGAFSKVVLLDRSGGLLPPANKGIERLKRVGVISGLMASGASLIAAALLMQGILNERIYNTGDGEVRANLKDCIQKLKSNSSQNHVFCNEYDLHLLLRERLVSYQPEQPMRGDSCIQIVDQKYLFDLSELAFTTGKNASYIGEIFDWERGGKTRLVAPDYGAMYDPSPRNAGLAQIDALEAKYLALRDNATALTTVNLSLAIRKAFVRLDAYRGTPNAGASA